MRTNQPHSFLRSDNVNCNHFKNGTLTLYLIILTCSCLCNCQCHVLEHINCSKYGFANTRVIILDPSQVLVVGKHVQYILIIISKFIQF